MTNRKKKEALRKKKEALKTMRRFSAAVRGMDRAEHFANGGDLASWRGVHTVWKDRKKESNRRGCRGRYRMEESR